MATDPPIQATTTDDVASVRCSRCRQMLAVLGNGGQLWIRHHGLTLLIEGLTPAQEVRVWCPRCTKQNAIVDIFN